ncbi:MAG: LutB/LldF family L-lactate oxidation iron-sulfur protein [Alphaproteobacteria bacterium]
MSATLTTPKFKDNARAALADQNLQNALALLKGGFQARRAAAAAALPEFEALRDQARAITAPTIANLDHYLERYEAKATEAGGHVHWARDAEEARRIVLDICRAADAKAVTKGKSMIAEEIDLNSYLADNGIEPIETDLGEYIVQLAEETPSHIIVPAVHKTKDQISDLFLAKHAKYGRTKRVTTPPELVAEARAVLRTRFLEAEVGITGANFLIAETGSSVIVTNEGNGDLTQALPRVHIVLASLEKVVPTLEDATALLRVLARSATGQDMSSYTTFSTGPRRADDLDGPEEYHVVLLDNGRSAMVGSEFEEMLRCIRCGACLNHCPIYGAVGGHAYGWVYPGPMGAVLTPALIGVEKGGQLPNASTLCGRCESVCPMRIPLPRMLRAWRQKEFEEGLVKARARWGLKMWAWLARHPRLYHRLLGPAMTVLAAIGRRSGGFRWLPLAGGWTAGRDLPAPEGGTFQDQWARQQSKRNAS